MMKENFGLNKDMLTNVAQEEDEHRLAKLPWLNLCLVYKDMVIFYLYVVNLN